MNNLKKSTVAIIIERNNHLEYTLPFLERFLKKKFKNVFIFIKSRSNNGKKEYLRLNKKTLFDLNYKNNLVEFTTLDEIDEKCIVNKINYICSFKSKKLLKIQNPKIKSILLQMNFDTFLINGRRDFNNSDIIIFYSDFWIEMYKRFFGVIHFNKNKNKIIKFSSPKYLLNNKKKQFLYKKYDLEIQKKYLLVVPLNFSLIKSVWSSLFQINNLFIQNLLYLFYKTFNFKITENTKKLLLSKINEKKLVEAIEKYAIKNNLKIILKGRAKSKIKNIWKKIAHKCFYDNDFYPSTMTELMLCSDQCIMSYSTAIFDCINYSLKTINLIRPSNFEDNITNVTSSKKNLIFQNIWRESNINPFSTVDFIINIQIEDFIKNKDRIVFNSSNQTKDKFYKRFYNG